MLMPKMSLSETPLLNSHHSNIGSSTGVEGKPNVIGWILYKKKPLLAVWACTICFLLGRLGRDTVSLPRTLMSDPHSRMNVETTNIVTPNATENIRYNYDLIIAVLVKFTEGDEVDRVRKIYSRYADEPGKIGDIDKDWSHRVLLVVADENAPDVGLLDLYATPDVGIFRVRARDGYEHIAEKTKALMAISEHINFSYLTKADSDTFPYLYYIMDVIRNLPDLDPLRLYAGTLAKLGRVRDKGHRWFDPEFANATLGQLPRHPVYHQV